MKKLQDLFKNEFFKGGIYLFTSSFLVNLLNYLFNLLVGRTLGPSIFGEISSLFAYAYIALTPTQVFSSYLIKKIGSRATGQLTYAKSLEISYQKKIVYLLIFFLFLFFLIPSLATITNLKLESIFTIVLIILFGYITSFYLGAIQGLRYFLAFSLIALFATLIKFVGALFLLMGISSLFFIYFFLLFSSLFLFLASYYYLKSKFSHIKKQDISTRVRTVFSVIKNKQFQILFLSTISLALLNNADIVFAKKSLSSYEAGIFASWSLFAKIVFYALSPVMSISFVFFSTKSEVKKHKLILKVTIMGLLFIFLLTFLIYTFFSNYLISFFFGSRFFAVLPFLSYASIFGSLYTTLVYLNNYFIAKESRLALVIPFLTPIYLLALIFIKKSIWSIIHLDIIFCLLVLFLYSFIYLKKRSYSYFKSL